MNLTEVRSLAVIAMFSDETLMNRLVLKGGNALELLHGVISRGSVDVDFSMEDEFDDLEDVKGRVFKALKDRFDSAGCVIFDERFLEIPLEARKEDEKPWWGGYQIEFKFIDKKEYMRLGGKLEDLQRQAHPVDNRQHRTFKIQISKREFCEGKVEGELNGYIVYAYTPEMCAIEKLRAICQQMPEYRIQHKRARARDFYDIHAIIMRLGVDLSLPENLDLCRNIFRAKEVQLELLSKIGDTREFHRPDWAAVKDSVAGNIEDFDFYFDFVVDEVKKLKTLWIK